MEDVAARSLGRVAANGIELAYETFCDPGAPPVVLIMGVATQMIAWPDELCEGLARRGLFVVRFDNRDVGESTAAADMSGQVGRAFGWPREWAGQLEHACEQFPGITY
jgi:alpha-beta hydrolase superfamily lysophospholipase